MPPGSYALAQVNRVRLWQFSSGRDEGAVATTGCYRAVARKAANRFWPRSARALCGGVDVA